MAAGGPSSLISFFAETGAPSISSSRLVQSATACFRWRRSRHLPPPPAASTRLACADRSLSPESREGRPARGESCSSRTGPRASALSGMLGASRPADPDDRDTARALDRETDGRAVGEKALNHHADHALPVSDGRRAK